MNNKLTVEMLKKIAEVLEVSIGDIVSNEPIIIQNNAANQATQIAKNENFYAEQKEVYEKYLASKDAEISRLTKQVEDLMALLKQRL